MLECFCRTQLVLGVAGPACTVWCGECCVACFYLEQIEEFQFELEIGNKENTKKTCAMPMRAMASRLTARGVYVSKDY